MSPTIYNFSPENTSAIYDTKLPAQVSLPAAQLGSAMSNSYWFSHLVTTTENTQYALLTNGIILPNNALAIRISLLDVQNPKTYIQTARIVPLEGNSTSDNGQLSIKATGFEISSSAKDNISTMVSAGSTEYFEYSFTVDATSRAILNAGTAVFKWGVNDTTQWSLPSCHTSGTLFIGNSSYTIDDKRSLSWYDRQYGDSMPSHGFTWFGVQFPGSDVRASIWLFDNDDPKQHVRFVTVRTAFGLTLVRYTSTAYEDEAWTSPQSNVTYQTRWLIEFENGDFLHVKSVRKDQEIYLKEMPATSAFATVEGSFFGQESGFAIIDIVPPIAL